MGKELTGYPSIDKPWIDSYPEGTNIDSVPEGTMYEHFLRENEGNESVVAINYFDNRITYGAFTGKIRQTAKALIKNGIKKGDIVSIASLSTPETMYLIYAVNSIGAICNLQLATSPKNEIIENLKETDSKMVFILDKILEKYDSFDPGIPVVVLSLAQSAKGIAGMVMKATAKKIKGFRYFAEFVKDNDVEFHTAGSTEDPAVIIYTSGSTGKSKGAVLSNRSLNGVAVGCKYSGKNYKPGDKFLCILPPSFSFGIGMIHMSFSVKMTIIFQIVPKPEEIMKMIKKHRPERFVMGPAITDVIEKYPGDDLSFLIDLTGGGGAITPEKENSLNGVLKSKNSNSLYLSGYGLTEVASAAAMNHNDRHKEQTAGVPFPMVNIKTIDLNDGHELKYNEEGELLVSSPGLMIGYFNDPEATAEAIEVIDGVRWLHTGDIARIDEDGFITITGRLKRIYITKDENGVAYKFFPQRLEEAVEKCEHVTRCAAIAIKDEARVNVPVIFISTDGSREDIEGAVLDLIRNELPSYYIPEKVVVLDEIPMNSSQKIDYKKLEETFSKQQ